jgi:uncharacterized protein (TIGR00251 family)
MANATSTPRIVAAETPRGVRVQIRVLPRASRAKVAGIRDGRLIVRVTAAPVDGAANEAVILALSHALDVPRKALTIVAGPASRNKAVEVATREARGVISRLEALAATS